VLSDLEIDSLFLFEGIVGFEGAWRTPPSTRTLADHEVAYEVAIALHGHATWSAMRTTLSLPREHAHRVVLFDPTLGSPAFMGRAIPIRSSGGERARGRLRAIERENALEAERHEHLLELQRELALKVKEKVITRAESRTGVVPRVLLVGTSARDVGALPSSWWTRQRSARRSSPQTFPGPILSRIEWSSSPTYQRLCR